MGIYDRIAQAENAMLVEAQEIGYKSGWNDAIEACIKAMRENEEDVSNWKVLKGLKKK